MRKATLWAVVPHDGGGLYTVTRTRKQALEYVGLAYYYNSKAHYEAWCAAHGLQEGDASWGRYARDVLSGKPDLFDVRKIQYGMDDLAALIRSFCGCKPIGCSFDSELETLSLVASAAKAASECGGGQAQKKNNEA